jgi:Saccharopine dehydrogenase NADP binding domain
MRVIGRLEHLGLLDSRLLTRRRESLEGVEPRRQITDLVFDVQYWHGSVWPAYTVSCMRILLVGAGGVGSAFCSIAVRRDFFEQLVVCDYEEARAQQAADAVGDQRFTAAQVDATSADTGSPTS